MRTALRVSAGHSPDPCGPVAGIQVMKWEHNEDIKGLLVSYYMYLKPPIRVFLTHAAL
jgi:hypothetical protein